ncbi:MAG TPA: diguanylate cyclase [Candidatus Limnocylindrales bacterium]
MIRVFAGSLVAVSLFLSGALVAIPAILPDAWSIDARNGIRAVAAIVLGATASAGLVWLYMRIRLDPLVEAAERLVAGDADVDLEALASGPNGRLARALRSLAQAYATGRDVVSVDRLTGIESRQAILAALSAEVDRASRYLRPLTVAFIDIDHLSKINETHGHRVGDFVLRAVAQTLRTSIRGTDQVGRYGGEEFLLIFTETGVDDGAALADKLRQEIERQRFDIDGRSIGVHVSVGIAGGQGQGLRADTLVRDADAAMYSAKSLGRNQTYVFAEPEDDAGVLRAPISPAGRARAEEIGLAARETVLSSLAAVIADLPGDRGRPSPVAVAIATSMAIGLELPAPEVERIRVAALLRDIGKVAVPNEILAKSSALTSSEWRAIVQHPRIAQVILEQATALRESVPLILHHHERFAGHGYPFGLRGDEIPLGARIVSIADAYDAMTNDRPYKRAMSHEAAIRELRRHAGTQFDPALVRLFCELFSVSAPEPDADAVRLLAGAPGAPAAAPELPRPFREPHVAPVSRPAVASHAPATHPVAPNRPAPRTPEPPSGPRRTLRTAPPASTDAPRPAAGAPSLKTAPRHAAAAAGSNPSTTTSPARRSRPVAGPGSADRVRRSSGPASPADRPLDARPPVDRPVAASIPTGARAAGTRRHRPLDSPETAAG